MKDFRSIYKDLARSRKTNRYHAVQFAILKAMDGETLMSKEVLADILIRKAFTPITTKTKLDNGREPMDTVYYVLNGLVNNKTHLILDSIPDSIFNDDLELEEYRRILDVLRTKYSFTRTKEYLDRHYVYTFVRQDISPEYQLVQAAHAAAKMGHRLGQGETWTTKFDELYFAVIGVANDKEMAIAIKDCLEVGLTIYPFYEPDIGNILTAFSTSPVRANMRKRLLSYKKLRFKNTTAK